MCGIFGIVKTAGPALDAKGQAEWARLMASLAALSTSRGMDSTGVMHVTGAGAVDVVKDAVPAWELLTRPEWAPMATPTDATLATIGHTRLATHGAVVQANAHPFVFTGDGGDVTAGVHNGVINNHAMLRVGSKTYAVDSANLIAALASAGVRDWRSILRRAEGTLALALVRVHGGAPTLFLTRRGNPLWVAAVDGVGAIAFASTRDILMGAVKLSRLTAAAARELDEGVMYMFKGGDSLAQGQRWWSKKKKSQSKKSNDAARVWSTPAAESGPGRTIGSNGREYQRCGSCLDWDQPQNMHRDGATVLCGRCKIAADAWQGSRWADGSKVVKSTKSKVKGGAA